MGHWILTTGILQFVLAYFATAGFGVLLNIPRRALNLSGWVGAAGWLTYEFLYFLLPTSINVKLAVGNLIAAVVIGGTSLMGGRGSVISTFFGVLIISVLAAGLAQIGATEPTKRIITGAVIVMAVVLDTYRSQRARRRN